MSDSGFNHHPMTLLNSEYELIKDNFFKSLEKKFQKENDLHKEL